MLTILMQTEHHTYLALLDAQESMAAHARSDSPGVTGGVSLESRSSEDWALFSRDLATLNDQIQHGGHDLAARVMDGHQAKLSIRSAEDLSSFFCEAFEAMTCICEPKSVREVRFRLGAYKVSNTETPDVTVLTKESVATTWAEIIFHRSFESM